MSDTVSKTFQFKASEIDVAFEEVGENIVCTFKHQVSESSLAFTLTVPFARAEFTRLVQHGQSVLAPPADLTKFEITRVTRGTTKNSGSPMWRCVAADGTRINIFSHSDPKKNTFQLFQDAGYGLRLLSIATDDSLDFDPPIPVECVKDGDWWNPVKVHPGGLYKNVYLGTRPDPKEARKEAIKWAKMILDPVENMGVIFDVETNSFDDDGEIVRIAAINMQGKTVLDRFIKPINMDKLIQLDPKRGKTPAEYHGITPERLADEVGYAFVYPSINKILNGKHLLGWNIEFDKQQLEKDCSRHHLNKLDLPVAPSDVMKMYGAFAGEWNPVYGNWKWFKLAEAIQREGLELLTEHDPVNDCKMTLAIIKKMAAAE